MPIVRQTSSSTISPKTRNGIKRTTTNIGSCPPVTVWLLYQAVHRPRGTTRAPAATKRGDRTRCTGGSFSSPPLHEAVTLRCQFTRHAIAPQVPRNIHNKSVQATHSPPQTQRKRRHTQHRQNKREKKDKTNQKNAHDNNSSASHI